MKELLIFSLFLVVGLGMLGAGIYYISKEKDDKESVKIYSVVIIIGACLTIGSVYLRF